jgi:hypothetical protein
VSWFGFAAHGNSTPRNASATGFPRSLDSRSAPGYAGGPLAATAGHLVGTGPGRGIGLLYVAAALLPRAEAALGCANRSCRKGHGQLANQQPARISPRPILGIPIRAGVIR